MIQSRREATGLLCCVTLSRMGFLEEFDYVLPEELVAHEPAKPRDSARLFVYDTASDTVSFHTVAELPAVLPASLIVINDTTVLPARVVGEVAGEPIELLFLVDQGVGEEGTVRALVNRRVRNGQVIVVAGVSFAVLEDHEKSMLLRSPLRKEELEDLLRAHGATPFPPYIHSTAQEEERRRQYQTMFAKAGASVAAPTASLHFTTAVKAALEGDGSMFAPVTLQVGLGTFEPIFPEHFANKKLHSEHFFVPEATAREVAAARLASRPITAIGTTVVRTLESAKAALAIEDGTYGTTDIFIHPPYAFTYPDILLTNFHVPKSSLLCLVQAFLQHKGAKRHITELYQIAIEHRFRFFSFGDAMLIK
jgi:S-adenosylmethionine:tRNA ribosyltransferase-isomerase